MITRLSQPDRPSDAAAASEDAMQQQMQALSAHQVLLITSLCTGSQLETQGRILLTQPLVMVSIKGKGKGNVFPSLYIVFTS